MGAGRATSAQLEAFRRSDADRAQREDRPAGSPSRSLWVSATLDPTWLATVDHPAPAPASVVRVDAAAAADGRLARLAHAAKRLTRSPVAPASPKKRDLADYVGRLADADPRRTPQRPHDPRYRQSRNGPGAGAPRGSPRGGLSKRPGATPTLALVHSRFRPADREREMKKVVAADDGNPHDRIVVATQAVEAGVDISAAVMFTEIAPWSSMVQRFGRANRYAELPDGADVHWIDLLQPTTDGPAADKDAAELALPYTVAELQTARDRLSERTDVAPRCLPSPGRCPAAAARDPPQGPRRALRHRSGPDRLRRRRVAVRSRRRRHGHPRLLAESFRGGRRPAAPRTGGAVRGVDRHGENVDLEAAQQGEEPPVPARPAVAAPRRAGRGGPTRMDAAAGGPALAGSGAPCRSAGRRLPRRIRVHRRSEARARTDPRPRNTVRRPRRVGPPRRCGAARDRGTRRRLAERGRHDSAARRSSPARRRPGQVAVRRPRHGGGHPGDPRPGRALARSRQGARRVPGHDAPGPRRSAGCARRVARQDHQARSSRQGLLPPRARLRPGVPGPRALVAERGSDGLSDRRSPRGRCG